MHAWKRTVLVPFPCELDAPPGADGLLRGRLLGVRCLRSKGVGTVEVSPMVGEAGQEAVQVAVTWVAANLTALQQWLGTAAEGVASGRPLLWRPGQEELYVSVSEVRAGTEGRCVLLLMV